MCWDGASAKESWIHSYLCRPQASKCKCSQGGTSTAKVDETRPANCGFWQIPLAKKSQHPITFITPFGRYCFNKLPFGISSAPEHFQKRMNRILCGLEGVLRLMDDVLVFGKDKEVNDVRLTAALESTKTVGATFTQSKQMRV